MGLAVIGSGFGRTGTRSLKLALEALGLGPCHHMDVVMQDPERLPDWESAVRGESMDWDAVFEGFGSAVDWPSTHYWRELSRHFGDAKVILTVRDEQSWWESYSATIARLLTQRESVPDAHIRSVLAMAHEMIGEQLFGGSHADKSTVLAAFRNRIEEVRDEIPDERLLVFQVSEGWEPLCRFLERPVPDHAFPRCNAKSEFWDVFGGGLPTEKPGESKSAD